MILNATVKSNKTVDIEYEKTNFLNDVGATGEKNATEIMFGFPETLCGKNLDSITDKLVFFKNKNGLYCKVISNGSVFLTNDITSCPVCEMQVVLKSSNNFEWRSIPKVLTFAESLNIEDVAPVVELLPEIIAILRRTISSAISNDISEEEAKSIIETNLAALSDLKAAYSQMVQYVNQYQHTEFSNEDLSSIAEVCRFMWDLGVQLSNAQGDNQRLREALDRYMNTMSAGTDFSLDGQIDVIIDEVGSELDNLIAELEEAKASNDAVKSVYENFYIGDETNGNT